MALLHSIQNIFFDRSKKNHFIFYEKDGVIDLEKRVKILQNRVDSLPEHERQNAQTNLQILAYTCGHAGRVTKHANKKAIASLVRWSELEEPEKEIAPLLVDPRDAQNELREIISTHPSDNYDNLPLGDLYRKADRLKTSTSFSAPQERAAVLNVILEKIVTSEPRVDEELPLSLDSNGILLKPQGFHSHVPYGLLNDRSIKAIQSSQLVPHDIAEEIKVRNAYEASDLEKYILLLKQQTQGSIPTDLSLHNLFSQPFDYAKIFSEVLNNERNHAAFMQEDLESAPRQSDLRDAYFSIKEEYEAHKKNVNSPTLYNALKIILAFVESGIAVSLPDQFLPIFSPYKKGKNGERFAFIEIVSGTESARILIDTEKHLSPLHLKKIAGWPALSRETYANLSFIFEHLHYFTKALSLIQSSENILLKEREYILHFILTNISTYYPEVERALENTQTFLKAAEGARHAYVENLYRDIALGKLFAEQPPKELTSLDIRFDASFLTYAEDNLPTTNFSPSLFASEYRSRAVIINHSLSTLSETVPFHLEESALDALRLHRGRPLINVVGGCKYLGKQYGDPANEIAVAVLRAGHAAIANIAVPGTQSGLGISFSEENIRYRTLFADLSHHDKAHMFSVTPGGNALFPGSPFSGMQSKQESFALSPIDTILTPLGADWDIPDTEIASSRYFTHIAYMESLFQRVSHGAKHIIIVGNGGLFTLAEISRLLSRKLDILLIEETGRFAEIAGLLAGNIPPAALLSQEAFETFVRDFLDAQKKSTDAIAEFFEKDFGMPGSETKKQALYRKYLREFFIKITEHPETIHTSPINTLEKKILELLG